MLLLGCGSGDPRAETLSGTPAGAEVAAAGAESDLLAPLEAAGNPEEMRRMEEALREALGAARDGRDADALTAFHRATASPALADWARLMAAEVHARSGDPGSAEAQMAELPPDLRRRMGWRVEAQALRAAGDVPRALRVVLHFLDRAPAAADSAAALREAGGLTLALGDSTAARHFDARAAAVAPGTTAAGAAAQELAFLGPDRAEEHLALVRFHLGRTDLSGAARAWERMARARSVSPEAVAEARVALARAFLERGRIQEMESRFVGVAPDAPAALRAQVQVLAARGRLRQGMTDDAVRLLEGAVSTDSLGAAAQEALYLLGDLDQDAGREERARAAFQRAVRIDAGTEWGAEAAMRLGALAYLRGDFTTAAGVFEGYRGVHVEGWRHQQATYWAGLSCLRLEERDAGRALLREARDLDPTSFYGFQAAAALGSEAGGAPFPAGPGPDGWSAALAAGALARVRALEALGRTESARVERERGLAALATVPGGLHALAEALHEEGRVVEAVRMGREARRLLGGWDARLLRSVYPLPFRAEIEAAAQRHGLDPFVVAGLIRQESLFQVDATSVAGAVGLMQVMPRTARSLEARAGRPHPAPRGTPGGPLNSDRLRDPATNVELGSLHLADLLRQHGGRLDEVLVAYNAGSGRLARWRSLPEHRDPQLFLERIPFRETRDYVRTVRENAAIYAALYDD